MEDNWKLAQEIWKQKSQEYQLSNWSFQLNKRKTSLAITNYTKKIISLSKYFLNRETCTKEKIENAILHEIAHVLAGYEAKHGPKWKEIAKKIGCNGEVCSNMEQPLGKYTMICPNKCFSREYYRKPKIQGKLCKKCDALPILIIK